MTSQRRLKAWKRALQTRWLRVNVKKTKMKISSENTGKIISENARTVKEERKFPCAVAERVKAVIPSSISFRDARWIRNEVVLEVK